MKKKILKPIKINLEDFEEVAEQMNHYGDDHVITLYLFGEPNRNLHNEWDSLYSVEKNTLEASELNLEDKRQILEKLIVLDEYLRLREEVALNNTLIVFLSDNYFYELEIPYKLDKLMIIIPFPYLDSLTDLQDETILICFDRETAFIVELKYGKYFKLLSWIKSDVPQKVRGSRQTWKGIRDKQINQHILWHLNEHMKAAIDAIVKTKELKVVQKVYLGGHHELIHQFYKKLPAGIKAKIKGYFRGEPDIILKEIKKKGIIAVENHKIDF